MLLLMLPDVEFLATVWVHLETFWDVPLLAKRPPGVHRMHHVNVLFLEIVRSLIRSHLEQMVEFVVFGISIRLSLGVVSLEFGIARCVNVRRILVSRQHTVLHLALVSLCHFLGTFSRDSSIRRHLLLFWLHDAEQVLVVERVTVFSLEG